MSSWITFQVAERKQGGISKKLRGNPAIQENMWFFCVGRKLTISVVTVKLCVCLVVLLLEIIGF